MKKIIALVIALVFFIPNLNVTYASDDTPTIIFSKHVTTSTLSELAKKNNLKLTGLHYVQGDIQGGYTFQQGENIDGALQSFMKFHKEFLEVSMNQSSSEVKSADPDQASRFQILHEQLTDVKKATQNEIISIDEVNTNDAGSISKLKKLGFVKEVKTGKNGQDSVTIESTLHESWAPYGGTADVRKTYTNQTFYFNKISDFGSSSTYEHETQVYDKKFADYAGYWSSNMPKAYYDTPFLDTIDNFTVGTLSASALKTNTQYFTYMSLKGGTATTATVRIKGQKGHRTPSSCYSTWCVFAGATTGTMALLSAPSGKSWQY